MKKHYNLSEIKVDSFVTSITPNEKETLQGGITPTPGIISALIASYTYCKKIGEELGETLSKNAPGVCKSLAGYCPPVEIQPISMARTGGRCPGEM